MKASRAAIAFACAAGVPVALVAATHLFSPTIVAVCGFAVAVAACAASPQDRRFEIAACAGAWALTVAMFGLTGAGCLILAQGLVAAAARLAPGRARPALLATTAVAALAVASGPAAMGSLFGSAWAPASELVAILAIGAPGLALARLASARLGAPAFEAMHLWALGPLYVALVIGGATAGLPGVAAAAALGSLAVPAAALVCADGEGAAETGSELGVLAAGLVVAIAMGAALGAGAPWGLAAPAGLLAGYLSLRVHAPTMSGAWPLQLSKSGQPRSLSETDVIGIGQSSLSPGSSNRTPRSAPGA